MAGQRKQPLEPLELGKGILMDRTARGAKNRYRNGSNVRWHDGWPQKIGGFIEQVVLNEDTGLARQYTGKARSYLEWESLDGQSWTAFGTACKLYLINNNFLYDITPVRRTASIVNGFATTNGSPIVTIYDPGHDAEQGDHVRYSGATAVGGITLSGEYDVTTIIDLDYYTVTHTSNATSTATGGGSAVADYDIRCGLETDGTLKGFGTGPYGEGSYGTARENSTFLGFARVWSLDNWGQDLLASPNGETLYVWEHSLGPGTRARTVEGAPANIEHMLVGPDDRHVIAFGANTVSTGFQDKMFVRWCVGDDYEDWLATSTNDAGSKRLDLGQRLIGAIKTRQGILIASDKGLFWLSVVGGQDVYNIQGMGEVPKLVGKRAWVDVGGTVYGLFENDFYFWDGALQILDCEIREYVFGTRDSPGINRQAQSKVQAVWIKEFEEIHWHFAADNAVENDRVAIYNLKEKCWYPSTIARETAGDKHGAYGYPIGISGGRVWLHENGVNAGTGVALPTLLESYEAELGNGDYEMLLTELVPDFVRVAGSVAVTVIGRDYPAAAQRTESVGSLTSATQQLYPRFRGRQVGLRFASTAVGDDWRMGQWRMKVGPVGAR